MPFRPDDKKMIVDPTPSKGGMHNSRFQLILTPDEKPIVAYIKYDEKGMTQLYLAKFQKDKWLIKQISDWNFRWAFLGGGDKMSKGGSFSLNGFSDEGFLIIDWSTETNDSGSYVVDIEYLKLINQKVNFKAILPENIHERLSNHPEMSVNLQYDSSNSNKEVSYLLKWESKKKSHGRHAPKIIPSGPISPLKLIALQ